MLKTISRKEYYNASLSDVFNVIDNPGIAGMHMTTSSFMMMGGKLNLQFLTQNKTGPGSKYRWSGKMMGAKMDFTVEVVKWVPGVEKTWQTIGEAEMIIYSWYQMHLQLSQINKITMAELSITYSRPKKNTACKILSVLFADMYCRWCLKNMLISAKKQLNNTNHA